MNFDFSTMIEKWPSTVVCRCDIEKFTGGLVNRFYLSNLDSQGKGPKIRVRVGRKIAYPVESLVEWLESRSTIL